MGADLYVKDLDRSNQIRGFEVSEDAVDVDYFRDCYNSYGLFSVMSATLDMTISWWQTADKKEWFRDDEEEGQVMTVEGVKQWRAYMKPLLQKFLDSPKIYFNEYSDIRNTKQVLVRKKQHIESFKDHAQLLIRFLDFAAGIESEIIWSV